MTAQPLPKPPEPAQPFSQRLCGHRVPKSRKHCPYCQAPRVTAAPLAEAILARAVVVGSVAKVSIEVATRLGLRFDSVERQIRKILQGKMQKVDLYLADAYAVALGQEMPAVMWGDEWEFANPVEPYGDEGF